MPANATGKPQLAYRYILSPGRDAVCFLALPALICALLAALTVTYSLNHLYFLLWGIFSLGHHLPGFIRAYGDEALFRRHRLVLLAAPALTYALVYGSFVANSHLVLTLLAVWAVWHAIMQAYGILRLYDSRAGGVGKLNALADRGFTLLLYTVSALIWSQDSSFSIFSNLLASGMPVLTPDLFAGAAAYGPLVLYVYTLAYACFHVWLWRAGKPFNAVKLIYAFGMAAYFFTFVRTHMVSGIFLLFAAELHHDVQYFAIGYATNRQIVSAQRERGALMRALFTPGVGRAAAYVALIAAYGSLHFVNELPGKDLHPALFSLFAALVGTSSLLHYYYDGFIWRRDAAAPRPASAGFGQRLLLALKHGGPRLWQPVIAGALLCAFAYGEANTPPQDPVRRGIHLTSVLPASPGAKVALADALVRRGSAELAAQQYREALALDPELVAAHIGLGRILYDDPATRAEADEEFAVAQRLFPQTSAKIDLIRRGTYRDAPLAE